MVVATSRFVELPSISTPEMPMSMVWSVLSIMDCPSCQGKLHPQPVAFVGRLKAFLINLLTRLCPGRPQEKTAWSFHNSISSSVINDTLESLNINIASMIVDHNYSYSQGDLASTRIFSITLVNFIVNQALSHCYVTGYLNSMIAI